MTERIRVTLRSHDPRGGIRVNTEGRANQVRRNTVRIKYTGHVEAVDGVKGPREVDKHGHRGGVRVLSTDLEHTTKRKDVLGAATARPKTGLLGAQRLAGARRRGPRVGGYPGRERDSSSGD